MDPVLQEFIDAIAERMGVSPEQVALDLEAVAGELGVEEYVRSFVGPALDQLERSLYPPLMPVA